MILNLKQIVFFKLINTYKVYWVKVNLLKCQFYPFKLEVHPPEQDLLRREPHQLLHALALLQQRHQAGHALKGDAVEQESLSSKKKNRFSSSNIMICDH